MNPNNNGRQIGKLTRLRLNSESDWNNLIKHGLNPLTKGTFPNKKINLRIQNLFAKEKQHSRTLAKSSCLVEDIKKGRPQIAKPHFSEHCTIVPIQICKNEKFTSFPSVLGKFGFFFHDTPSSQTTLIFAPFVKYSKVLPFIDIQQKLVNDIV